MFYDIGSLIYKLNSPSVHWDYFLVKTFSLIFDVVMDIEAGIAILRFILGYLAFLIFIQYLQLILQIKDFLDFLNLKSYLK